LVSIIYVSFQMILIGFSRPEYSFSHKCDLIKMT
jgi:hypothetical protein